MTYSPKGAGHALFMRSELTQGQWRIHSDSADLARWLQATVQGMLNPETAGTDLAVAEAAFSRRGDVQGVWSQTVRSGADEIALTWSRLLEPLMMAHGPPAEPPDRHYGASVVMIPALEAGVAVNGRPASRPRVAVPLRRPPLQHGRPGVLGELARARRLTRMRCGAKARPAWRGRAPAFASARGTVREAERRRDARMPPAAMG